MRYSRNRRLAAVAVGVLLGSLGAMARSQASGDELEILDVRSNDFSIPNAITCILYRTSSSSRVDATVHWGTESGRYPNSTPTQHKGKGTQSYAQKIQAPDLPCTIYFVVRAKNEQGAVRESTEHHFAVVNMRTPPGAFGFVTNPDAVIPVASGTVPGGLEADIKVTDKGSLMWAMVRVDITIPVSGNLSVVLVSPSGTQVRLHAPSTDTRPNIRGIYGDGVLGDITAAQSLDVLQGEPIEGTWKLRVSDLVGGRPGTLNTFGLFLFPELPDVRPSHGELLPQMYMQPPGNVSINPNPMGSGSSAWTQYQLQFDTTFANRGLGPLQLHGVFSKDKLVCDVYQDICKRGVDDPRQQDYTYVPVRSKLVGRFVETYNNGFGFENWAEYTLLDEKFKPAPGAVNNVKTTFDICDCNQVDGSLPGSPSFNFTNYPGTTMRIQGLDPGWADTYPAGLANPDTGQIQQFIDVTHTPDGTYYLVIEGTKLLDQRYPDRLLENAAVKVRITNAGTQNMTATTLESYTGVQFEALKTGKKLLSYRTDVQKIFDSNCTSCHDRNHDAYGAPMSLEPGVSWNNLVWVKAKECKLDRVDPGSPEKSYLWHKVCGTQDQVGGKGSQMPPGGQLSKGDLDTLKKWIETGALDD